MSFTGKTKASTYKDILQMDNSNSGIDTTIRTIKDGEGTASALQMSDDQVKVKPQNDDTTSVVEVQDKDGNTLFVVDSSNDLVKALDNYVNTQYETFGIRFSGVIVGTHMMLANSSALAAAGTIGTGTDPDTSLTLTTAADDYLNCYWYLQDDITIDAVDVFVSDGGTTSKDVRFHLMSYDVDTSNGATSGDLSNGTVLADGADLTGLGHSAIDYQSMTVQSADVSAGKVVIATFFATEATDKISINMRVKYHLR